LQRVIRLITDKRNVNLNNIYKAYDTFFINLCKFICRKDYKSIGYALKRISEY
jgi:hypothetical protein